MTDAISDIKDLMLFQMLGLGLIFVALCLIDSKLSKRIRRLKKGSVIITCRRNLSK